MDLRSTILAEHSKAQCDKIVEWVGSSQQRFNQLFQLFLQDEYRVTQRASWPVSHCVEANPTLMKSNFGKLVKNLQKPNLHNAIKRNTVRLLQYVDIPKKYQGEVMNCCFEFVANPREAVAIKAFSLTVLGNLAKQYPEIIPEIKLLITAHFPHQTHGFKSRANLLLRRFSGRNK
jgi:hypothetical protein